MRILEIIMDNRLGGIAQRAMLVADHLRGLGHETVFVTPDEPGDIASVCRGRGYEAFQPKLRRPHPRRVVQSVRWAVSFPVCVWQMCKIIRRTRPDVVHLNGLMSLQGAVAARWCGMPIVWHLASTAYPRWLVRLLMPYLRRRSHVVSIAQGVRDYFLGGTPVSVNESIIHEPIDFDGMEATEPHPVAVSFRRQLGIPMDAKLIVSIGNLSPRKGFDYLLEAAGELRERDPAVYLAIVGSRLSTQAAFIRRLEATIRKRGLGKHVLLVGERRDVYELLMEADLFVLASVAEGTPLAIIEAMASGVPVVATSVGGIPSQIQHGVTGLLVPPRSPDGLVEAMGRLLTDRELAERCVRQAKATVREKFSMHRFQEQFLAAVERETTRASEA